MAAALYSVVVVAGAPSGIGRATVDVDLFGYVHGARAAIAYFRA